MSARRCPKCRGGASCSVPHGTPSGYVYHVCRCPECMNWKAGSRRGLRTCGTEACKCGNCTYENRLAARTSDWQNSNQTWDDMLAVSAKWNVGVVTARSWLRKCGFEPPRYWDYHGPTEEEKLQRSRDYQRRSRASNPSRHAESAKRRRERRGGTTQSERDYMKARRQKHRHAMLEDRRRRHRRDQDFTLERADRRCTPWTPAEWNWLRQNLELPVKEQALVLHRTIKGIQRARLKIIHDLPPI